jgi:hypothetical protein
MYQDIFNPDGSVTRWQGGAATIYADAQEAKMAETTTAIQQFEALRGTVRASAQALIRQVSEVSDLLDANPQVAALATAAEPGALVGNTGMTREAVLMGIALITSYLAYIDSQLGSTGITVRQAVYRLG